VGDLLGCCHVDHGAREVDEVAVGAAARAVDHAAGWGSSCSTGGELQLQHGEQQQLQRDAPSWSLIIHEWGRHKFCSGCLALLAF
jgi:hypothetical protein